MNSLVEFIFFLESNLFIAPKSRYLLAQQGDIGVGKPASVVAEGRHSALGFGVVQLLSRSRAGVGGVGFQSAKKIGRRSFCEWRQFRLWTFFILARKTVDFKLAAKKASNFIQPKGQKSFSQEDQGSCQAGIRNVDKEVFKAAEGKWSGCQKESFKEPRRVFPGAIKIGRLKLLANSVGAEVFQKRR